MTEEKLRSAMNIFSDYGNYLNNLSERCKFVNCMGYIDMDFSLAIVSEKLLIVILDRLGLSPTGTFQIGYEKWFWKDELFINSDEAISRYLYWIGEENFSSLLLCSSQNPDILCCGCYSLYNDSEQHCESYEDCVRMIFNECFPDSLYQEYPDVIDSLGDYINLNGDVCYTYFIVRTSKLIGTFLSENHSEDCDRVVEIRKLIDDFSSPVYSSYYNKCFVHEDIWYCITLVGTNEYEMVLPCDINPQILPAGLLITQSIYNLKNRINKEAL